MSKRMVQRAKAHINHRDRALNNAIKGTLDSRRKAEKARADAEQAKLEAKKRHAEMERKTAELGKAKEDHERWVAWINALRAGDEVHLRRLNCAGKVVRMQWQKQSAVVVAGAIDIEVGLRDLCPPGNSDS
jgi:dsDNA-specific endonuclease/ATPase MutS2